MTRLLVVEDDYGNQQVARQMLERYGHRVDIAANGQEALEAVERTTYAAIFMDCEMPIMDGYEATRRIRASGARGRDVPVIAMMATAVVGDAERSFDAGMNDSIAKPVRADELARVLARWLPRGRSPLDPRILGELLELAADAPGVRELATGFARRAEERLAELRAALAAGDRDAAMRICHSLKGSAGTMAATQVSRLSEECERAISSGELDRGDALLRELDEELPRVQEALDRAFGEEPQAIGPDGDES